MLLENVRLGVEAHCRGGEVSAIAEEDQQRYGPGTPADERVLALVDQRSADKAEAAADKQIVEERVEEGTTDERGQDACSAQSFSRA